jgi:hypothetical protein
MRVVTVREMLVSEGYDPATIVPEEYRMELDTLVRYEKGNPIHAPFTYFSGKSSRRFPIHQSEFKWCVIIGATEVGYGKSFVVST